MYWFFYTTSTFSFSACIYSLRHVFFRIAFLLVSRKDDIFLSKIKASFACNFCAFFVGFYIFFFFFALRCLVSICISPGYRLTQARWAEGISVIPSWSSQVVILIAGLLGVSERGGLYFWESSCCRPFLNSFFFARALNASRFATFFEV